MAFPRKLLNDNEQLVLDLRPHWLAIAFPTLALVFAIVVGLVAALLDWPVALLWIALVLIVLALVNFLIKLLGWSNTNFVLTSDRIITRRGVLTKSGIEIPLERVNTVFFDQRLFERMVGAGDLAIESAGERGTEQFDNIRKPAIVQREIYVQMEDNENRKFDRVRAPAPAPVASLSPVEQVERLHGLLQQGAITPVQYEAEKARILRG
ncbi:MAG TPA: PH domain-containing protein [Iamia sp.]|nr:PH domain-containing protein [Iamia sp.]